MKRSIWLFFLIVGFSCNRKTDDSRSSSFESFDRFFDKFESDTSFRSSRIQFPLTGYNSDDQELNPMDTTVKVVRYNWDKRMIDYYLNKKYEGNEYVSKIEASDTLVVRKVYIENSGFEVESFFRKINGEWFLVKYYYRDE